MLNSYEELRKRDPKELRTVVVTDCGSTTTKALMFERKEDRWHQTFRGEAPTTVEDPVADVTVGALNAFQELQELSGRSFLSQKKEGDANASPFTKTTDDAAKGIDLYLSTSSAGGGLQMAVAGVVGSMTAESAERAALGAGAIVLDTIAADDGREDHERTERLRHLRPDIVLLAGGVDGGAKSHLLEVAELLVAAAPRPRFGDTLRLPVIYAGNKDAANEVKALLSTVADVSIVENVRPTLEQENLAPAREAIHELFLSHVMSHSPGYSKLLSWSPVPVMPTPAAVGDMVLSLAKERGAQVLCADIGGATTDMFSVFRNREGEPVFNRTVSANFGMSYSIANVLIEAGVRAIAQWLPFTVAEQDLKDRLRNKMIRPTSIPHTMEDLLIEQAVCREALRLSLEHHRSLAIGLGGGKQKRTIAQVFGQKTNRYQLVDMMKLDLVIGSGGVLSHAPKRLAAALMMIDGFELQGITQITVDSIFMLPHLGVFSSVHPEAAAQILNHDCIVNICHCIAPVWSGTVDAGARVAEVYLNDHKIGEVLADQVTHLPHYADTRGVLKVVPRSSKVLCGSEAGGEVIKEVSLGAYGIILDGRNRPLTAKKEESARIVHSEKIHKALGLL